MSILQEEVEAKKAKLDSMRPLAPGTVAALDAWYDVELTYTSNALEGNTLTRSETAIVLEKGITVSGKPLKDHLEATGHRDALLYMRELAKRDAPVLETDIRSLHHLILAAVDPAEAGKYSGHQRTITGSDAVLPGPHEIPALMQSFVAQLNATEDSPEKAFDAHEQLVSIHPFSDGNGRTSRLLMNLLLLRQGFPPLAILPEHRLEYHERLEDCRKRNYRAAYHGFLYERLLISLERTLAVLHVE